MSDSRDLAHDESGDLLQRLAQEAGHDVVKRLLCRDDAEHIRARVEELVDATAGVVLVNGGTGVSPRDVTPEAVAPLFDKHLPGFGELFRHLSYQDIGSPAMLSRAQAGIIRGRAVFLLPGSPAACRLAMEKLILPEAGHLVGLLRRHG